MTDRGFYKQRKPLCRLAGAALAGAIALGLSTPAAAEGDVQATLDALAGMGGEERLAFLEAEANKEGKIVVYAADDPNVMKAWADAFGEKYPGIEVIYQRMNTRDMISRVVAEVEAGRPVASLLGGVTATELATLKEKGLLASYHSPEAESFDAQFKDENGYWTAHWFAPEIVGVNVNQLKKEDAPITVEDLANSGLERKLGRRSSGGRWLAGVAHVLGEEKALELASRIADLNPLLFSSTSALTNALTSGQISVAFDIHAGNIGIAKERGAPVDYVVPEPLFLLPAYTVFLKSAPHPHAAALNYDWRLAKDGGQGMYKDYHQNGPRPDTEYAYMDIMNGAKTTITLNQDVLTEIRKYDEKFKEMFVKE